MNILPSWKRALVLEMHSRGATIREIFGLEEDEAMFEHGRARVYR